ncbi:hypothetical protein AB1N83_001077 [Pleurotus pulmonarius]
MRTDYLPWRHSATSLSRTMTSSDPSPLPPPDHPFLSYLVALLSVYELGPNPGPLPAYDGPSDRQTDAIVRSLASVMERMYQAEADASRGNEARETRSQPHSSSSSGSVPQINTDAALITTSTSEGTRPPAGTLASDDATDLHSETSSDTTAVFGMSQAEELKLLRAQVLEVAHVCNAVAIGDLSQKITVPSQGSSMVQSKDAANKMVDNLRQFVGEVTRVTLEIGSEGRLGGQVYAPDAEGAWYELVENLNRMCSSMTDHIRSTSQVIKGVVSGDFTMKIQVDALGEMLSLKETVNKMTDILSVYADEVTRVSREIGTGGHLGVQTRGNNFGGTWRELTDSINIMAAKLTLQIRTVAAAIAAIARGDLTQKIAGLSASGEMLELVDTINDMISQLNIFAKEVKKVARQVGTEGKLDVQAEVGNVRGIWQEISLSMNTMAGDLATQVQDFNQITAAAMDGDFSRLVTVEASGELDSLKTQINRMVLHMSSEKKQQCY